MNQWQSLETAPAGLYDEVLLCGHDEDGDTRVWVGCALDGQTWIGPNLLTPVFWMPLPTLPEDLT